VSLPERQVRGVLLRRQLNGESLASGLQRLELRGMDFSGVMNTACDGVSRHDLEGRRRGVVGGGRETLVIVMVAFELLGSRKMKMLKQIGFS